MSNLKKQLITVGVLVVAIALLATTYFLFIKDDGVDPVVVEEKGAFGESMKNGRPYIVEEIENEQMNRITVHNKYDEYSLIHKKSGAYKIEGLEGYETNPTLLSQLRVNAMHLLALDYLETAELDNLEQYGIDKKNPAVWFEVVYNDEQDSYRILIGDKTPDNKGYYAMLEGREALYVIDTGIETAILQPRIAYVTPKLVDKVEDNHVYTLNEFVLNKKGSKFVSIEKASGNLTYGNNSTHRLTYPAYNYATSLANFEMLLSMLKDLTGTETLYYGDSLTDEVLEELGFFDSEGNDISDYSFKYSYPAFTEYVYVMKDEEQGDYIVYSLKEKLVARVNAASLAFLEWDMLLWVSAEVYMLDIEDIATLAFSANGEFVEFKISGSGSELKATGNSIPVETVEFKELYKDIMYILVTSHSDYFEYGKEQLKLVITTEKGERLEYAFYEHTATNSYYTLNGFGEFYVSADKVLSLKEKAFALVK